MKTDPIQNLIAILKTIVKALKKSKVTLSCDPTLRVKGQNVLFFQNFQNATPSTDYIAWSCDSCLYTCITLYGHAM